MTFSDLGLRDGLVGGFAANQPISTLKMKKVSHSEQSEESKIILPDISGSKNISGIKVINPIQYIEIMEEQNND